MSQTEDYSPEAYFPGDSKKLLQKSRVISTVFYLVRKKRTLNESGIIFFNIKKKKKKTDQHVHVWHVREGLGPGKKALLPKEDQHWHPRKRSI